MRARAPGRSAPSSAMAVAMAAAMTVAVTGRAATAAPLECAALAHHAFPGATIASAVPVAAGAFEPPANAMPGPPGDYAKLPAFCRVSGSLHPSADSDIRFEVWLPASGWNGKFVQVGNGGAAGSIIHASLAEPLARGYAVANNDTGHQGGPADFAWAFGHPEKVTDYAWRSQHALTVTGKAITRARYGQAPRRSYWLGCSTGGRQGLKEAQRFPADYDGIVAGAPASQFMRLMVLSMIQNQAMNGPGHLTPAKVALLHEAAIAACDAADGVTDRVIADPMHCGFDPGALLCREGGPAQCLDAAEVATARRVYAGVVDHAGRELFPGPGAGAELLWAMGGSMQFDIGTNGYRALVAHDATWSNASLDPQVDVARAEQADGGAIVAMDPDLRPFFARGGKLLSYHGTYDGLIPWRNSLEYYEATRARSGAAASDAGMRLFLVPGMEHCTLGEGPYEVDWLGALDAWVTSGKAPDVLAGAHPAVQVSMDGSPPQPRTPYTRPVCAWPAEARYRGTGDVHVAASWECAKPR